MTNYREILRLSSLGYTQHNIAASLHCSRNTIRDVMRRSESHGISWPLSTEQTNAVLDKLLYPEHSETDSNFMQPDCEYIHRELAKDNVNMSLLWHEYCIKCSESGLRAYQKTQFSTIYRNWAMKTKATMRIQHKPGDAMQVDWAGSTIPISDPTGLEMPAYLFVAVLPCSCYTYVEATGDMLSETWITCHVHAYEYFGGVTRLLIPDNLKTGVIKNTRFETVINKSYYEMAEYYDTAIVPARVEHPKDKPLAEGTVKYASTWIIGALRNEKFFTLDEVREAVSRKLEELNSYPFKKREGNRRTAFDNEERGFMKPLPDVPYEPAVWSTARVSNDYLITDGKNKYSVPFDLIGNDIDIRITRNTVEAFFNGSRVASHVRSAVVLRDPVVKPEHMPEKHRKYLSYNEADFRSWAESIGPETSRVTDMFLTSGSEPEQGFKSCASLKHLSEKHGSKKLEEACRLALSVTAHPNIRSITTLITSPPAQKEPEEWDDPIKAYKKEYMSKHAGITRGASYFRRGGNRS